MNWKWIIINDVNIVNFEFSKSFNESIENKVTAEQDALAQKNKLEQVKYEAQQQIEKAKAQAESIKIQAQAVTSQWWADYVKLQWINKWDWVLPKTSLWEKTNTLLNLN
jgi:regulator of protease activity HflC (stomatin/prohibitin superfamily)